ncbi:MAG TPA: hypothetical protein PLR25_01700, partial [Planctomycetaceae bacterium]|nr:hypothetical protein [Planctomycetaceae bacterium]
VLFKVATDLSETLELVSFYTFPHGKGGLHALKCRMIPAQLLSLGNCPESVSLGQVFNLLVQSAAG